MINTITEFIAIDLEATGLDYKNDTIIEIALAHFVDGVVVNSFNKCVNPNRNISTFIHNLTGINQQELDEAQTFAAEAQEIRKFIGDLPVVAHNSYYDVTMLNTCLQKVSVPLLHNNPVFDSLLAARIAWPRLTNHRLGTVIKELNIEVPASHRALPDAIASGKVFLQAQDVFTSYSEQAIYQISNICATLQQPVNRSWAQLFNTTDAPQESFKTIQDDTSFNKLNESDIAVFEKAMSNTSSLDTVQQKIGSTLQKNEVLLAETSIATNSPESYLLPVLKQIQSSHDRVVISTNKQTRTNLVSTIENLEQESGITIPYTILQSRDQYLCLQKYENCLQHANELLSEGEKLTLLTLIPWVHTTVSGDISKHKGFNLSRNRQLWYKLSGSGSSCNGNECINTYNCFSHRARKRAEAAQLIVVDHHGFFTDMQLDFSFIPPYDAIVFDDASDLNAVGYGYLNRSIWFFKLKNIIQTFSNQNEPDAGLYGLINNALSDESGKVLIQKVRDTVKECEKSLHRFFMKFGKNVQKKNHEKRSKISYTQPIALEFNTSPEKLIASFDTCFTELDVLVETLNPLESTQFLIKEINEFKGALGDVQRDIQFLFAAENENFTFWTEEFNNPHKIRIQSSPVDPSLLFSRKFYDMTRSVVFLSHTHTVMNKTTYMRSLLSLEQSGKQVKQFVMSNDTEYVTKENLSICTETHKKGSQDKMGSIISTLQKMVHQEHTKILIVFQNPYFQKKAHKILENEVSKTDYKLYSQDIDSNIENLLPLFGSAEKSILLTTSAIVDLSFVPKEETVNIVYTQLPFPDSQHPALKGVCEHLESKGSNPFTEVLVPHATLMLRKSLNTFNKAPNTKRYIFLDSRAGAEKYSTVFTNIWNNQHTLYSDSDALLKQLIEA